MDNGFTTGLLVKEFNCINFSKLVKIFPELRGRASNQQLCRAVKTPTKIQLIDLKVYQFVSYFLLDLKEYVVACLTYLSQGNSELYDFKSKTFENEIKTIRKTKQINIAVTNFL